MGIKNKVEVAICAMSLLVTTKSFGFANKDELIGPIEARAQIEQGAAIRFSMVDDDAPMVINGLVIAIQKRQKLKISEAVVDLITTLYATQLEKNIDLEARIDILESDLQFLIQLYKYQHQKPLD